MPFAKSQRALKADILQNFEILFEHLFEVHAQKVCSLKFQLCVAGKFRLHNYAVAQHVATKFRNGVAHTEVQRGCKAQNHGQFLDGFNVFRRQNAVVLRPLGVVGSFLVVYVCYKGSKHQIAMRNTVQVAVENHVRRVFGVVVKLERASDVVQHCAHAQNLDIRARELVQYAQLLEQLYAKVECLFGVHLLTMTDMKKQNL